MSCEFSYIKRMEERMSEDAKDMLKRIYEPTIVGMPLTDARRDVCVLPDGEIRSYGNLYSTVPNAANGQSAYLSSVDGGISWTKHYSKGTMNSCTYVEEAKVYLAIAETPEALWVKRSFVGPDDNDYEMIKVVDGRYGDTFLPKKSVYTNRVWFTSDRQDRTDPTNPKCFPVFIYSDDFGKTWTVRELPATPPFVMEYPHKGPRWNKCSGSEPYAMELSENKMMMLIRSPHDQFFVSYSYDGGDSWTDPAPSTFYGTNTTPFMLHLSDGRILAFWNNTKPLPQPDYSVVKKWPNPYVVTGQGECGFTNRDAAHAAISLDGGETFEGYREFLLNPLRNNTDFRYVGGITRSIDKSVHQFQAYELPFGKVLVSAGQNIASRLVIFDVNWLLETNAKEDFLLNALEKISTHTYVNSLWGSYYRQVGNGHCAWNRAPAAYLYPDPDGDWKEVLRISKHHDERLHNDIGGATWNFPASKQGKVSVVMKLTEQTARLTLTDRWYNPSDPYVAEFSPFAFEPTVEQLGTEYVKVDIDYDTVSGNATMSVDGKEISSIKMNCKAPTGISYIVLQCATEEESEGFYVRSLEKTV